jgi:hypothetical protein
MYFAVIIIGYLYRPIGDTSSGALAELGVDLEIVSAYNLSYVVTLIALTVAVELVSRATFEETRIRSLRGLDKLLGALAGVFYGALWASLFLVPGQYAVSQAGGPWTAAISDSSLVPTFNSLFNNAVLDVVSIFFAGDVPRLYRNTVSLRVSSIILDLASVWRLPL